MCRPALQSRLLNCVLRDTDRDDGIPAPNSPGPLVRVSLLVGYTSCCRPIRRLPSAVAIVPLWLYINRAHPLRFDSAYGVIFGLLMIPKNYYVIGLTRFSMHSIYMKTVFGGCDTLESTVTRLSPSIQMIINPLSGGPVVLLFLEPRPDEQKRLRFEAIRAGNARPARRRRSRLRRAAGEILEASRTPPRERR